MSLTLTSPEGEGFQPSPMGTTKENVYTAFIGEAKAYFRLLAYAEKAEEEKVP